MDILGEKFEVYSSVPTFYTDWRWYKSLFDSERKYNRRFLDQLDTFSHSLLDYRCDVSYRSPEENLQLENLCLELIDAAKEHDENGYDAYKIYIDPILKKIADNLTTIPNEETKKGFSEVLDLLNQKDISIQDIRNMKDFPGLFGREQCYLSFTRE